MSGAKVLAINAPRPEYPYEARRQHATGSGVAVLHVDLASGNVTSVALEQSTGHAILDAATVSAFLHERGAHARELPAGPSRRSWLIPTADLHDGIMGAHCPSFACRGNQIAIIPAITGSASSRFRAPGSAYSTR